jgi:hypothetical protein
MFIILYIFEIKSLISFEIRTYYEILNPTLYKNSQLRV